MCAHLLELLDSTSHQWFHLPLIQQECEEEKHGRPDQTQLREGRSHLCIPAERATHPAKVIK